MLFCFGIFYCTSGRNGTERNDNFYFLSFPTFWRLLWLKMKPQRYFLIFWIFLPLLKNFLSRLGQEWNGMIIFIFSHSQYFPTYLAWNEPIMVFFNFLNYFAIFLEFSITRWVGTKRNDNFYFLYFLDFSNLFWLEM